MDAPLESYLTLPHIKISGRHLGPLKPHLYEISLVFNHKSINSSQLRNFESYQENISLITELRIISNMMPDKLFH
jgi:hypothetical protein